MLEEMPIEPEKKDGIELRKSLTKFKYDPIVEEAYQHLKGIFIKHVQNAMLEAGQYLVNKMYNGNYELAKKREPNGTKSLAKLYKKIQQDALEKGNAPSRTWLYDAVNLAIDHHIFENHALSSVYGRLGHSHKVNLTYASDIKIKKTLITETDKKKYSVARLRERIREEKRKIDIAYIPINEEMPIERLMTFDAQKLETLKARTHSLGKDAQNRLSVYQGNLEKIEKVLAKKKSKTKTSRIISVSRLTDIPAFYSDWFFNRIKQGFVQVRESVDFKITTKVSLAPEDVTCLVFWTKNPRPMIDRLDLLKDYHFYFHFTLTPYEQVLKPFLPPTEKLITIFIQLAEKIGKQKVIWRYDPIFLNNKIDIEYHKKHFTQLADRVHRFTDKCVINFLDYNQISEESKELLNLKDITEENMQDLGEAFQLVGERFGLKIETCTPKIDLTEYGISAGKCVDDELIATIIGEEFSTGKDSSRGKECGCVESIDIGTDNTCAHGCLFCYATKDQIQERVNHHHYKESPLLMGKMANDDY